MSGKLVVRLKKPPIALNTSDGFQNFVARVGAGTGNQNDGSHYGFRPITRIRLQLEWAYRGSWIIGKAVDSIAEDMTREGVDIHSDDPPEDLQALEKEADRLGIWNSIADTIKWSRLYGGALAYMVIAGQDPETPLNLDTVGQGQFKGLMVFDRWLLQPSLMDLVGGDGDEDEFGPDFGMPRFYDTVVDINGGVPRMKIHYTRLLRLDGVRLPYWQKITENLWGMSIVERLWDRLLAFDSTTVGAAQLVYKAHLRTIAIEGLREIVALGGKKLDALVQQIAMIRAFQSNEHVTLIDARDKFETHQYSFSGLDAVMLQFGQQISGAIGVPLVRLFGQSPAGLNSTGESDLRTYYDSIKQQQVSALGRPMETLYRVLYISKFGREPPKSFEIEFRTLWQLTSEQKGALLNVTVDSITKAFEAGLIDRATGMKELRRLSRTVDTFSSITDKMIDKAEKEVAKAPSPEELGMTTAGIDPATGKPFPPAPPAAGAAPPGGGGKKPGDAAAAA